MHAFTLSNYPRLPTPPSQQSSLTQSSPPIILKSLTLPPQQYLAIFCELSAMLPHQQIQRMVLEFENPTWAMVKLHGVPNWGVEGLHLPFHAGKSYHGSNRDKN